MNIKHTVVVKSMYVWKKFGLVTGECFSLIIIFFSQVLLVQKRNLKSYKTREDMMWAYLTYQKSRPTNYFAIKFRDGPIFSCEWKLSARQERFLHILLTMKHIVKVRKYSSTLEASQVRLSSHFLKQNHFQFLQNLSCLLVCCWKLPQ